MTYVIGQALVNPLYCSAASWNTLPSLNNMQAGLSVLYLFYFAGMWEHEYESSVLEGDDVDIAVCMCVCRERKRESEP